MTSQRALKPFLDKQYRDAYLEVFVRAGIANQIQALRKKLNLSQAEFGCLIDKTQSFVSHIEDNEYSGTVKILLNIAKALNIGLEVRFVSYDRILDSEVSPTSYETQDINESYRNCATISTSKTHISTPLSQTPAAVSLAGTVAYVGYMYETSIDFFMGTAWINIDLVEERKKWQKSRRPSSLRKFQGSGTPSSEKYTVM